MKDSEFNRRDFLGAAAVAGAGLMMARCGGSKSYPTLAHTDVAPDGPPLKAGLIGCGGRGTGAAGQFLKAGPNLQVVALSDTFEDRLQRCRETLEKKSNAKIADDRCYIGFEGYKKLIESDVDIVLMATPPVFRPAMFEAAVDAKKHVFMEKPLGVDPVGIRSILATAEKAKSYNLSVVTGTQRRHQREYLETYNRVANGAIGRIVAARCSWDGNQLWFKPPQEGWSDMEAMIRDWVNWKWLSGDHIVEQHVHNIDVINWFTGVYPVSAVARGGRARRVTGDQFDFFNVEFTYEKGIHVTSLCRQIDGCENDISEYIWGTEGSTNCKDTIYDLDGKVVWQYQEVSKDPAKELDPGKSAVNPYEQEHVDLVTAIRTNKPINEAENTAKSTLCAVMGRQSAYTGKKITWEEIMSSDLRLGPEEYLMGAMDMTPVIPIPGTAKGTSS